MGGGLSRMFRYSSPKTAACILLAFLSPCVYAQSDVASAAKSERWIDEFLVVDVNQQGLTRPVPLLRDAQGERYVSVKDLQRWRLRVPEEAPRKVDGEDYVPLSSIKGLIYRIDDARQILHLEVPATAFELTRMDATRRSTDPAAPVAPPGRGGFLNYDLFAENARSVTQTSAFLDLGVFNTYGTGTLSGLARHIQGNDAYASGSQSENFLRLDTSWAVDNPEKMTSFRLGDTTTVGASQWGRSVRFGGIQYGTNFATNPYLITFPLQGVAGEAVLPSTMDIYLNNVLTSSRQVPPGPFSLTDLPAQTGLNNINVVVRDIMGRERIYSLPIYNSPALLAPGLDDFSYNAGFVRENYGISSNDYGRWMASARHRRGLTDTFTGEVSLEVVEKQTTAGVGAALQIGEFGVLGAQLAASEREGQAGGLASLVFERRTLGLSFGGIMQVASREFTQLGMALDELAPEWRAGANVSYSDTGFGSFGLTWAKSQARVGNSSEVVTGTYSVSVGRMAYFNLSVMQSLVDERELGVYAGFTVPFGQRSTASLTSSYANGKNELTAQAQQSLPVGEGWGYRVTGSDRGRADAMASVQTGFGLYSAEVARRDDVTGVRANATGALALLEGDVYPTRRIEGSFGLVQVPGYENVRVYSENHLVGRTNADGNFLLTRLRPYERNLVGIEQRDLPLDARVDALKMNAIPYYRSATVVPFPVKPSNGAELTILLADGQPMPVGAEVRLNGSPEAVPVAMRGVVYLTGLRAENVLDVYWNKQSCTLNVSFKAGDDPVPYLGAFVCAGVMR